MPFVFDEAKVQTLDTRLNSAADQLETLADEIATISDGITIASPTPALLLRIEDRYRRISVALNALRDGIDSLDAEFLADLFDLPPQTVQIIIDDLEATGNLTLENVLAAIIDPARIDTIADLIDPDDLDPELGEAIGRVDDELLDDLLDGTVDPDDLTDQQLDDLRAVAQALSPDTPAEAIAALTATQLVAFVQNAFNTAAEQRRRLFDLQINGQGTVDQIQDLRDQGLTDEEIAAELGLDPDQLARTIPVLDALAAVDTTASTDPPPEIDEAFLQARDPNALSGAERQDFIDQVVIPLLTGDRSPAEIRALVGTPEASRFVAAVLRDVAGDIETVTAALGPNQAEFFAQSADQLRVAAAGIEIRPTRTTSGGGDDGGLDNFATSGSFDGGSGGGSGGGSSGGGSDGGSGIEQEELEPPQGADPDEGRPGQAEVPEPDIDPGGVADPNDDGTCCDGDGGVDI